MKNYYTSNHKISNDLKGLFRNVLKFIGFSSKMKNITSFESLFRHSFRLGCALLLTVVMLLGTANVSAQTFFGVASTPADPGTNTTSPTVITPPITMVTGDLVVIFAESRVDGSTIAISQAGGQTWTSVADYTPTSIIQQKIFWCRYNGTWSASPSVSFSNTTCISAVMSVFRPSAGTSHWGVNVNPVNSTAATAIETITGVTTTWPNTVTGAFWGSSSAVTWGTLAGTGWSKSGLGAQYRNTSGNDQSISIAYYLQNSTTTGATGNVSQTESGTTNCGKTIMSWYEIKPPTISSLSSSSVCQGTNFTITGTNFQGTTGVTVNGTAATYSVNSTTQITVTCPVTATSGNVVVINAANSASIALTVLAAPTTAAAGNDITVCSGGTSINLAANTPSVGTGAWSVVSGAATFGNATSATSTVTGFNTGANTCRWTTTNGTCASTDDMVLTNAACTYCTANATGTTLYISNVTLGTINKTTLLTGANNYNNYTSTDVAIVNPGVAYPLLLTASPIGSYGAYIRVYIDYNNDGDFVDAGELVVNANGATIYTYSGNITIPTGAVIGTTVMRVILSNVAFTSPCGSFTNGEVEEYGITIAAAVACSGTPTAGTASANPSAVCSGSTSVVSLSGQSIATGLTYQWEQSNDGTTGWANVTGGSGATTVTYTTPALTSAIYYRCIITCSNSGLIATSSVTSVSIYGPGGIYRTVANLTSLLYWNTASTWECGLIPPLDGTANVFISSYNGAYSVNNTVVLDANANVNSITVENGAMLSAGPNDVAVTINDDFNINSGGILTQKNWVAGNTTIQIKGDFLNNGNMQGFTGSTGGGKNVYIEFNGTSNQIISGSGTFGMVGTGTEKLPGSKLIISNTSGIVTMMSNFNTLNNVGNPGTIEILTGAKLYFGSSSVNFSGSGNLTLNGTTELKASTFNTHYAMTGTRTISTSTSRIIYTNPASNLTPTTNIPWSDLGSLTTNMGAAGLLTIGAAANLYGELAMIDGDISTTAANLLTVGVSASFPGTVAWTTGTVLGPLRRWYNASTNSGNTSGLFPVGNKPSSTVLNRWLRIEYTNSPSIAGFLTAEFKGVNPSTTSAGANGMSLSESSITLSNIATEGYWEVMPTTITGGVYNMTSRVNTFNSVMNYASSRLIKSPDPHTIWTLIGAHGAIIGTAADYELRRTGMSGYSYFAVGYSSTALPIELISFQANCTGNKQVEVAWSTASEYNTSHYLVKKSRDGVIWTILNTLGAAGNSTSVIEYALTDTNVASGTTYYKLTQFDIDGVSETFNIASVNCGEQQVIISNLITYPNPSNEEFYLDFYTQDLTGPSMISIFDSRGMVIYRQFVVVEKGSNVFHIQDLAAAPGMYYIKVSNGTTNSYIVKHSLR